MKCHSLGREEVCCCLTIKNKIMAKNEFYEKKDVSLLNIGETTNYINDSSNILHAARKYVANSVNTAMVQAYWLIGKRIVTQEQNGNGRAEYGKQIIENLSVALTKEFGKGFGTTNLKYIRQFYVMFPIGHALRGELSWTHYRLLLRVEDEKARTFYLNEAAENGWSSRQLERQINSFYYQRLLASHNKNVVKHEAEKNNDEISPSKLLKDPYVLEFLNIKENSDYLEADLEKALINKLQDFLLELGRGFAFVARQQRITTEVGKHYYVDLVLYNYILKCFVLIDLKKGVLTPQDVGQMDMYVRHKQLFSSQYKLYMPTEEELKRIVQG